MQTNWAALQSVIKGGGGKNKPPMSRDSPVASGGSNDARGGDEKKHAPKKKRRRANAQDTLATKRSRPETEQLRSVPSGVPDLPTAVAVASPPVLNSARILDDTFSMCRERHSELVRNSAVAGFPSASGDFSVSPSAALTEAARLVAVSHLCFQFEKLVSPIVGKNRWANAFEEMMIGHDCEVDPLLPSDEATRKFCGRRFPMTSNADGKSIAEVTKESIQHTTNAVVAAVASARNAVAVAKTRQAQEKETPFPKIVLERVPVAASEKTETESKNHKRSKPAAVAKTKLSLGKAGVEIRDEHLLKLHKLYEAHRLGSDSDKETNSACMDRGNALARMDAQSPENTRASLEYEKLEPAFLFAAFCCVARYTAAQGGMHRICGGHHCALCGNVFDVLKFGELKVEAELFASPLNCRFSTFCSAFPDTDFVFGSLGSFFEFSPTRGSFQVNPPFEEGLVLRIAERLERLLLDAENNNQALSFVVITPFWPNRVAWEALRCSKFRVQKPCVIPAREHGYLAGAQHTKRQQWKPASCDSSVLVLQSSSGKGLYPVSSETLKEIAHAFRKGKE